MVEILFQQRAVIGDEIIRLPDQYDAHVGQKRGRSQLIQHVGRYGRISLDIQKSGCSLRGLQQFIEQLAGLSADERIILAGDNVNQLVGVTFHLVSCGSPASSETIFAAATSLSPGLRLIRRTPCVFLPIERI